MDNCKECGRKIEDGYGPELFQLALCFSCRFWTEYVKSRDNPTHFVVKGQHYVVAAEDAGRFMRGHGGAKFIIRPLGSSIAIITTNLWAQGTIPEHFRNRLPDNAEFIPEVVS